MAVLFVNFTPGTHDFHEGISYLMLNNAQSAYF